MCPKRYFRGKYALIFDSRAEKKSSNEVILLAEAYRTEPSRTLNGYQILSVGRSLLNSSDFDAGNRRPQRGLRVTHHDVGRCLG